MKLFFILFLIFNSQLALSSNELDRLIENSYNDTSLLSIDKYKTEFFHDEVILSFTKKNNSKEFFNNIGRKVTLTQNINYHISYKSSFFDKKYEQIPSNGQQVFAAFCFNNDSMFIITLLYGDYDKINSWFIQFIPDIFEVKKDASIVNRKDLVNHFNNGNDPYFDNRIIDEPKLNNIYPYYNKDKLLKRAYQKGICTLRKESHNGSINKKSNLYNNDYKKTSMYLIKGDKVRIISESVYNNINWYRIVYKGKKEINMWIKVDSVDLN